MYYLVSVLPDRLRTHPVVPHPSCYSCNFSLYPFFPLFVRHGYPCDVVNDPITLPLPPPSTLLPPPRDPRRRAISSHLALWSISPSNCRHPCIARPSFLYQPSSDKVCFTLGSLPLPLRVLLWCIIISNIKQTLVSNLILHAFAVKFIPRDDGLSDLSATCPALDAPCSPTLPHHLHPFNHHARNRPLHHTS